MMQKWFDCVLKMAKVGRTLESASMPQALHNDRLTASAAMSGVCARATVVLLLNNIAIPVITIRGPA